MCERVENLEKIVLHTRYVRFRDFVPLGGEA
jgi:hypothetical protein